MKTVPDEILVDRCQVELPYQTTAFEELVRRYQQRVMQKICGMLKNRQDAEDVAQEVFIKAFNALPRFRRQSSFSTWLYTITVNTCLNYIEKKKRRPWRSSADDVYESADEIRQDEAMFHLVNSAVEQSELKELVVQTVDSLPEKAREIIRLRYFEELDYETISRRLKLGLSATKMRLKRAKEELRVALKSSLRDAGYEFQL